jgi:hypothetical protein
VFVAARDRIRCVHPADENPRISINERGLVPAKNSAGDWLIHGAADGSVHAAADHLVWLLPLLERRDRSVVTTIQCASRSRAVSLAVTAGGKPDLRMYDRGLLQRLDDRCPVE